MNKKLILILCCALLPNLIGTVAFATCEQEVDLCVHAHHQVAALTTGNRAICADCTVDCNSAEWLCAHHQQWSSAKKAEKLYNECMSNPYCRQ
jgi:hypothetical protein